MLAAQEFPSKIGHDTLKGCPLEMDLSLCQSLHVDHCPGNVESWLSWESI